MNNIITETKSRKRGMDLYDLEAEKEANAMYHIRQLAPTVKIKGGKRNRIVQRVR